MSWLDDAVIYEIYQTYNHDYLSLNKRSSLFVLNAYVKGSIIDWNTR